MTQESESDTNTRPQYWTARSIGRATSGCRRNTSRLCTAARPWVEDEGDWAYSPEWWGSDSDGQTVFRDTSQKGNGVVSVLAYPASRPSKPYWPESERWLQQRYAQLHPAYSQRGNFKILGYQWRVLRFNEDTRQSTAKVMAAYRENDPSSLCLMQQPRCLAVPYLKSMVSLGLSGIGSSNYDLSAAAHGQQMMRILCIGNGGGSLPLYLASKIQGAVIDIVEIDPLVISASTEAMGFPRFSVMARSGERAVPLPDTIDEVLWKGIHERLYLYESDAETFVLENASVYDMIFIDAYDGEDIFPHKLWDPDSAFLRSLSNLLHPKHGTVVVNLHSDSDARNPEESSSSFHQPLLPMGRYVSKVCRAYKDVLIGHQSRRVGGSGSGVAFTVSVPWVCNSSLVVCRGLQLSGTARFINRDMVMNTLVSNSTHVERLLNLPFSCLTYIKRGLVIVE